MDADKTLQQRLLVARYSRPACVAALGGEAVPYALGDPIHRLCLIRGIRYHHQFGAELRGLLPVFTRSLNASSIMSNDIPEMHLPDDFPYCIWHPRVASKCTYRQLVARYPQMAYQVGRACAVAGYNDLYKELDILPDSHIAEEAREAGNSELFNLIMCRPARYSIMDDYELRVNLEPGQPVPLNGDTAVRWMLEVKQGFRDAYEKYFVEDGELYAENFPFECKGYDDKTFNITEDMNVDEQDSTGVEARLLPSRLEVSLLSSPLPYDLPTVQKDLLIVMAAYTGNVDRYARLRRPRFIGNEVRCCVRGIYHNTLFAVWWSQQRTNGWFENAITARHIMNNVLSYLPQHANPYLIWWPTIAARSTYRKLATLRPKMLPQIIHATIYADYTDVFDELVPLVVPDTVLLSAASQKKDTHYLEALQQRLQALGGVSPQHPERADWKSALMGDLGPSNTAILKCLSNLSVTTTWYTPYDGYQCDAALVETATMLPHAWRVPVDDTWGERALDYVDWPPAGTLPDTIE